jgi:hypothetical protein
MTKGFAERVCSMVSIHRGGFEGWFLQLTAQEDRLALVGHSYAIQITCQLPHRDTGILAPVYTWVVQDDLDELADPKRALKTAIERVRSALVSLAQHEMNESILVDGARLFDPHVAAVDPKQAST